ncbi:MAG: ribonuclease H family protein, partial [Chloroflexus sp.]
MNQQQYYLVVRGRQPGLYRQWHGADGAQAQVDGFPNALYKRFATLAAAREWVATLPPAERAQAQALLPAEAETLPVSPIDTPTGTVVMYTDGSAIGNPGPGGYGVVL